MNTDFYSLDKQVWRLFEQLYDQAMSDRPRPACRTIQQIIALKGEDAANAGAIDKAFKAVEAYRAEAANENNGVKK